MQEQLKTQASEVVRTRELLQLLSKQKLPAKVLPWLQHDLAPKNQGDSIVLREATSITTTIRTRPGALAASSPPSAAMPLEAATLTPSQKDMLIDGKRVNLSPGMNITAEIKTGQWRIIEFLLSPVQRAGSESLRER